MLARFFIDRPVLAWVISIVIVLLGGIAAALLPVAEYPEITPPTVQVTARYPGANVQVVADTQALVWYLTDSDRLSPAARQTKQKDLQSMQQRMAQRQQALQDSAQAKEDELMEPLRGRINSIIQGIRAENNFSLIIDADAGGGFLLAADPALNITARVLQRLQAAQ